MSAYRWRPGAQHKSNAQVAGDYLESLRAASGGLSARLVVDDAKAEDSPIHDEFEWEDGHAADAWRLHQARNLINAVIVVVEGETERATRAFVVVTENEVDRYESIHVVMGIPALKQQVLARALRELEAWERKYAELQEFAGVVGAIKKAKRRLA